MYPPCNRLNTRMSNERFPEEIIHEILSHSLLCTRPDVFLDPLKYKSFFRLRKAPPAPIARTHLLRVSRRWTRIAIPLFYVSIWISDDSQANSILRIFKRFPTLGHAVRDLRLDGRYYNVNTAVTLRQLIQLTPNIENICLSISPGIYRSTLPQILGAALPRLSTHRTLYIGTDWELESNSATEEYHTMLNSCITDRWSRVVSTWLL